MVDKCIDTGMLIGTKIFQGTTNISMDICIEPILLWSLVVFVVTVIIMTAIFYVMVMNWENDLLNSIIGQYGLNCQTIPPVMYREAVYIPHQNGVYEQELGTALVDISYATSNANCENILPIPNPPGFTNQLRVIGNEPTNGQVLMFSYIFWNPSTGQAAISFTGTEFRSEWKSNFQFQQVPPTALNGYESGVLVHQGFYNIYLAIRDKLWNWWNDNRSWITTLYITGHSLGGALSTLCAYDFAEVFLSTGGNNSRTCLKDCNGTKDCTIKNLPIHYSIGAPRSGNPTYAQVFNQRLPTSIRINNTEDLAPQLPLATYSGWTYEHTAGNVPFTTSLGSLADDHNIAYNNLPTCAEVAACHV
jgi:hypothetical protein